MLIRPGRLPDRHPPLPSGQSLNPATTSHHARLSFTGHQQGFTHVHPSGLPFAHAAGMEPAALRLPPSSAPAVTGNARQGQGQATEHGPGTTAQLTCVDLQSGSSLNTCDLASHGEEEVRGGARAETRFHFARVSRACCRRWSCPPPEVRSAGLRRAGGCWFGCERSRRRRRWRPSCRPRSSRPEGLTELRSSHADSAGKDGCVSGRRGMHRLTTCR